MPRNGRHRLLAGAAVGAALVAGVAATATPAAAARPADPSHGNTIAMKLPRLGARSAPFSAATTAADIAATPWVVGILIGNDSSALDYCTGTIVSPTKVVTSANCSVPREQNTVEVVAGRNNLADDSVGYVDAVTSTMVDPLFTVIATDDGSTGGNVEVLTLATALPSAYPPIGLSAMYDESPYVPGSTATDYGYNLTAPNTSVPVVLDSETVTTQAAATCQADNSGYPQSEEVCATTTAPPPPSDENNWGDPLVANGKLIGIGNALNDPTNSDRAFERMSVFHDLITADLGRTPPGNEDWGGDGNSDLLGENSATGSLTYFEGFGANPATNPGFSGQFDISDTNWSIDHTKLLRVDNWTGDGKEGLLAVDNAGLLQYYATPAAGVTVGAGFNQFTNIIAIDNFAGDGRVSLIGERTDGTLWLYERSGDGWLNGNGVEIGAGFNQFTHLTAFHWTDTDHIGLLGVTAGGDLRYYPVDGAGHWTDAGGQTIGTGFGGLPSVLSVGSFGGTDTGSLMTVDWNGYLKVYSANGKGGWINGNGKLIGTGFFTMRSIF